MNRDSFSKNREELLLIFWLWDLFENFIDENKFLETEHRKDNGRNT